MSYLSAYNCIYPQIYVGFEVLPGFAHPCYKVGRRYLSRAVFSNPSFCFPGFRVRDQHQHQVHRGRRRLQCDVKRQRNPANVSQTPGRLHQRAVEPLLLARNQNRIEKI